jgi:hypothetical protein
MCPVCKRPCNINILDRGTYYKPIMKLVNLLERVYPISVIPCHYCQKTFNTRMDLINHIENKCDLSYRIICCCNKRMRKVDMDKHINEKNNTPLRTSGNGTSIYTNYKCRAQYPVCGKCNKAFISNSDLTCHVMRTGHSVFRGISKLNNNEQYLSGSNIFNNDENAFAFEE